MLQFLILLALLRCSFAEFFSMTANTEGLSTYDQKIKLKGVDTLVGYGLSVKATESINNDGTWYMSAANDTKPISASISGLEFITSSQYVFDSRSANDGSSWSFFGSFFSSSGTTFIGMGPSKQEVSSVKFFYRDEWKNHGTMVVQPASGSSPLLVIFKGRNLPMNNGCVAFNNVVLTMNDLYFTGKGCVAISNGTDICAGPLSNQKYYLADSTSIITIKSSYKDAKFSIQGFGGGNVIIFDSSWDEKTFLYNAGDGWFTIDSVQNSSSQASYRLSVFIGKGYNSSLFNFDKQRGALTYSSAAPNEPSLLCSCGTKSFPAPPISPSS